MRVKVKMSFQVSTYEKIIICVCVFERDEKILSVVVTVINRSTGLYR